MTTQNVNEWPVYGELGRVVKEQRGFAFHAHGGYAQEIYADAALGTIDAVELFQFGKYRGIQLEGWYHLLNTGLRLPAFGASDFAACRKLGDSRTYACHDGQPTFRQWLQAVAAGRSFMTSGPLLLLEVEGQKPGATISRTGDGPHQVNVAVRARSEVAPITDFQLVVNGKVVDAQMIPEQEQRGGWFRYATEIQLEGPAWIAARVFSKSPTGTPDADAHTNPVFVEVDGRKPYQQVSADWLIDQIAAQITFHERRVFENQHRAIAYFNRAKERLERIRERGGLTSAQDDGEQAATGQIRGHDLETESSDILDEFLQPSEPTPPEQAVQQLETIAGLRVDLVAAEPMVTDPVVAAFDERGRLFVGELVDYPYKPAEGGMPLGRVRVLEDTDGDGIFDRSDVFADGLLWPTGIVPWRGGLFVGAAPDIWYFKDVDEDRRADASETVRVFKGFGTGNQQGMFNNLVLGLDGWVYGAASGNGGTISGRTTEPVEVGRQAFRFHPDSLQFEVIGGNAQFGNTFDDWGNRYVCSESTPFTQVMYPGGYLDRNPFLTIGAVTRPLVDYGVTVFRISPVEPWRTIRSQRRVASRYLRAESPAVSHTHITAAAGLTVYRGDALPEPIRGNLFVGCSQTNLVHRRRLVGDGLEQAAERVDGQTEIIRSPDTWFRPVNFVNAPDGTLYVLDLYRETIESVHIPLDVAERLDLRRGRGFGRIYRLAPADFRPRTQPMLAELATAELVAELECDNGWRRDTAQRLITERGDRSAVEPLKTLLATSDRPTARLHALYALHALAAIDPDVLAAALADPVPEMRVHALRLAESTWDGEPRLWQQACRLAADPTEQVRLQVALSLGRGPKNASEERLKALETIARRDAGSPWISTAVLSSLPADSGGLFSQHREELYDRVRHPDVSSPGTTCRADRPPERLRGSCVDSCCDRELQGHPQQPAVRAATAVRAVRPARP